MSKKKILMKTSLAMATAVGMFTTTPTMIGDLNAKEEMVSTQPSADLKEGSNYNKVGMTLGVNKTVSVEITLQNDMFQGLKGNQDVTSWFKNMPKGLKATVHDNGHLQSTSESCQIDFSGTPKEIYYGEIEAVIPKEYLQSGKDLEVTTDTVFEVVKSNLDFDMLKIDDCLPKGTKLVNVPAGNYRIVFKKVDGTVVQETFQNEYLIMENGEYGSDWTYTGMKMVDNECCITLMETNDKYRIIFEDNSGIVYDETGSEIAAAAPGTKVIVKCSDPDALFYSWKSLDDALPDSAIVNIDQAEASFIMPKSFVKLKADYGRRVDVIDGKVKKDDVEIQYAKPNELLTLYADEKPGCKFLGWDVVNGRANIEDDTKPVTGLYIGYKSVVIKAVYEEIPGVLYPITIESDEHGSASASMQSAESGSKITLDAIAEDGYHFKEWQVIKGNLEIVDHTFMMPKEEVVIKAVFEKDEEIKETAVFEIMNISKSEHTIGDKDALIITVSLPLEKVTTLMVDGVEVPETAYQMAANQMQLSVTSTFLDTLSVGTHTVQILHGDDAANFDINIKEAIKEEAKDEVKEETKDEVKDEVNEIEDQVKTETDKKVTVVHGNITDTKQNTDDVVKQTARQNRDVLYLSVGAMILGGLLFVKRKKKVRS